MSGWRGILGGALALIALQALVQPAASTRVGGLVGWSTGLVRKFMDPTVPAIADHSKPHAPFDPVNAFASALGSAIGGLPGKVGSAVTGGVLAIPGAEAVGGASVGSISDLIQQQQQRK